MVAVAIVVFASVAAAAGPDVRSLAGTEDAQARTLRTEATATVDEVDTGAGVVGLHVGDVPVRMRVAHPDAFRRGERVPLDVTVVVRPAPPGTPTGGPAVGEPTPPERGVHAPSGDDRVDPAMRGPLRPGR
jgi:hypothetical protein